MKLEHLKQRDVLLTEAGTSEGPERGQVFEVAVPSENNLYWAILLSYLLSSDYERIFNFLKDLKTNKDVRSENELIIDDESVLKIQKTLQGFIPLENECIFSDSTFKEIVTAFRTKLDQDANILQHIQNPTHCKWDDELKLNTASNMLHCTINMYYPKEQNPVFYQMAKGNDFKIILFQYKNVAHESHSENINEFRFAMPIDHSNILIRVFNRPKLSTVINYINILKHNIEKHGENFLSSILQSRYIHILPLLYKSPYITLKLSQAGFETNPLITYSAKPSAFYHAAANVDTIYIRILYDYVANCRHLFQHTVRDPNGTVLSSLEKLDEIFKEDRSKSECCNNQNVRRRVLSIQSEFSKFSKYQQHIVSQILELNKERKEKEESKEKVLRYRKKLVMIILESYVKYFYYESNISSQSEISEKRRSYLQFNEYYQNIDAFSCLFFFDKLEQLKNVFQQIDKDIYDLTESTFFLLMLSNESFSKFERADKRCIPLFYRISLENNILNLLKELQEHESSPMSEEEIKKKRKDEHFGSCLTPYPEVRDELLNYRIEIYLEAANSVTFHDSQMKGILIIERALHVLGESIKSKSVVSCLMSARLPKEFKLELKKFRDNESHRNKHFVQRKISIKEYPEPLTKLQSELKIIHKKFKIVALAQCYRTDEALVKYTQKELNDLNLSRIIPENFEQEKNLNELSDEKFCIYHNECLKLSLEIIDNLSNYLTDAKWEESHVIIRLKSIECIFETLSKDIGKEFFQNYLDSVRMFHKQYLIDRKITALHSKIDTLLKKYSKELEQKCGISVDSEETFPSLKKFLTADNENVISETDINVIVESAISCYEESIDAKNNLLKKLKAGNLSFIDENELLDKLIIHVKISINLTSPSKKTNKKAAKKFWKKMKKYEISIDELRKNIKRLFKENHELHGDNRILFIKMVYQRYLENNIYDSISIPDDIFHKLNKYFMRKVDILLHRIEVLKSVLVEEDEEIYEIWCSNRNVEMDHHMKFLMRCKYLREMSFRASLEMAFFDCLNLLTKDEFKKMFEKFKNLFEGINLRNVLSHGHSILETVGGLLDEDDLPNEMINKMVELIEDYDTIKVIRELIPFTKTLSKEGFKKWIKDNKNNHHLEEEITKKIEKITKLKDVERWQRWLSVFPLL